MLNGTGTGGLFLHLTPKRAAGVILAAGYVLFALCALLLFHWLVEGVQMDVLLAFLLSHACGAVILYYMRRALCYLHGERFSSHNYGMFLLINAIVLVVNALTLYTLDIASDKGLFAAHVFATIVCMIANAVLQLTQRK